MDSPTGFFKLPLELRNEIYRLLVCPVVSSSPLGAVAASTEWDTNILHVNRQTYNEVHGFFYKEHSFIRIRFSSSNATASIHALGLQGTIRKDAYRCPWMVMIVKADPIDQAHRSSDLPVNIVLACHDVHLLANLLHYMYQQGAQPKNLRVVTDLTFHIRNQFKASAQHIYERLVAPTRLIPGIRKRHMNLCADLGKDFFRAFRQSFKHYWTPDDSLCFLQRRSLAMLLAHNGLWEDAARAVLSAYGWAHRAVDKSSSEGNIEYPLFIWFLKSRLEVLLYAISLQLRMGLGNYDPLGRLPSCCQALAHAQPSSGLVSLGHAIESYLQFTRPFYEGGTISPALIQATLHHDSEDKLQLGTRAMLRAVESDNPYTREYNEMIDRVDESLQFAGLDRLVARFYRVAGIP
ncbi:MAG: hypothetical protein LQ346_004936 [Caloplaca aetnensis]|nr:MAG: hypothetical protein LQ346_004936 [Caloplaca aetnensis]